MNPAFDVERFVAMEDRPEPTIPPPPFDVAAFVEMGDEEEGASS